jgi:integrase
VWWLERFASKTVGEITPDLIAEARDELAAGSFARGKEREDKDTGEVIQPKEYKRSGATVNRYIATLSHLFTIAVKEWRLSDRNPVRDISKKKEARGRVRFLSDEERDALLAACKESEWPQLHALVLLAISTGARRGELIHLKWADIDLKKNRATVHETKNGEPRTLPLVGKALEAIRELKLQDSARSEYVFPQPSGFPGPYESFDAHWYAAMKAAGITNMRFHDLRHTTASYLAQQGASLIEIADTLGHKTLSMVKRYSHLAQSHKVSVIERMAKEKGL